MTTININIMIVIQLIFQWSGTFLYHSHTVYFTGIMVFTLTSQMYHRISVLVPVLVQVPEYLSTSMSTRTSTITLELTSTSTVWVPEIQYSSTASMSTEYEYPSPACQQRDSYYKGETVMRLSYLSNGNSYTGKMISLHWIGPKRTKNGK